MKAIKAERFSEQDKQDLAALLNDDYEFTKAGLYDIYRLNGKLAILAHDSTLLCTAEECFDIDADNIELVDS